MFIIMIIHAMVGTRGLHGCGWVLRGPAGMGKKSAMALQGRGISQLWGLGMPQTQAPLTQAAYLPKWIHVPLNGLPSYVHITCLV